MPYPNEHACRLHDPESYQEDSFRRIKRGNLVLIIAKRKGQDQTEAQAYRYPKDDWTEEAARAHCRESDGHFEPATQEDKTMNLDAIEVDGKMVPPDTPVEAYKAESEREKLHQAQKERAGKYDIAPKAGGNLTPPKGFPESEEDYGDPVNYRYPVDDEHVRAALGYFNREGQREDGGYSSAEWAIIGERIAKRCSSYFEMSYIYRAGKVAKKEEDKSVSLDELTRLIRDAFYAQFVTPLPPGAEREHLWVKEVFDDQVIVETSQGLFTYSYAIGADGKISWGEPVRVKVVYQPVKTLHGHAVKALGNGRIGGYGIIYGSARLADLSPYKDFFTPETDFWLDKIGPKRPMLYQHTLDATLENCPVVGIWDKAVQDEVGVWLEGQLEMAHQYRSAIEEMIEKGLLPLSTDSASHLVRREQQPNGTNKVTRWPILAASLTPTPAEPRLVPVEHLKSAYKAIGLEIPEPAGGADAGASGLEAMRMQAEVEWLLSIISSQ